MSIVGKFFTHGGRKATGIEAIGRAKKMVDYGAGEILLPVWTGTARGKVLILPLTRAISEAVTMPVIASGGVGNLDHLEPACIIKGKADAVLEAEHFSLGRVQIQQAKEHMAARGIDMRRRSRRGWMSRRWTQEGFGAAGATGSLEEFMFAWMNCVLLALTVLCSDAVYWSRSREKLWRKVKKSVTGKKLLACFLIAMRMLSFLKLNKKAALPVSSSALKLFLPLLIDGQWQTIEPVLRDLTIYTKNELRITTISPNSGTT